MSLKLQNVIDRDINDIDLNITKSDWNIYQTDILKKYKFDILAREANTGDKILIENQYNKTKINKRNK